HRLVRRRWSSGIVRLVLWHRRKLSRLARFQHPRLLKVIPQSIAPEHTPEAAVAKHLNNDVVDCAKQTRIVLADEDDVIATSHGSAHARELWKTVQVKRDDRRVL